MRGSYTLVFDNISTTTATDFFEIDAAAEEPVEIFGLFVSQNGVGDVGDAAEELLRYSIVRGNTTSGGGTSTTPQPLTIGDEAASFAGEVTTGSSAVASAGTGVTLHEDAFNVRAGLQLWFPPEARPSTSGTALLCVRLLGAPADAITLSGCCYIRQIV